MEYLEAWDPGEATAIVIGYYDEVTPFWLHDAFTVDRDGAFDQLRETWHPNTESPTKIVESFELSGSNEFVANLVGKEIIGVMKFLEYHKQVPPIVWQDRQTKATVRDRILKDHGLWFTPTRAEHETGRHINDAIIHALAYLKAQGHRPTIEKYWGKP